MDVLDSRSALREGGERRPPLFGRGGEPCGLLAELGKAAPGELAVFRPEAFPYLLALPHHEGEISPGCRIPVKTRCHLHELSLRPGFRVHLAAYGLQKRVTNPFFRLISNF